jgi:hypothetical protein
VSSRVHFVAIAVLIVSASSAMPAVAGDRAEQLIKKGLELRKRGDDLGALPLFDEAFRISPTPRAAAQRGFCAQALGRWTQVEADLTKALESPDDAWVKKNRAAIDESLRAAKTKIAVIEVVGDPPGSEVLVNGNVVGQLPLSGPVRIEAGEIEVELRAAGHRRASKSLRVDGGQYQRIVVRAEVEAATPPAPTAPAPTPAGATPAPASPNVSVYVTPPSATVANSPAEPVSAWRRAPKWVSWGLGAASLGVGVYGLSRYLGRLDDFDAGCAFDERGVVYATSPTLNMMSCEGLRDDYRSGRRLAIIGMVGAGAFAITGFVLYIAEPKSGDGRTALACAPDVGALNRLSIGCSLRF